MRRGREGRLDAGWLIEPAIKCDFPCVTCRVDLGHDFLCRIARLRLRFGKHQRQRLPQMPHPVAAQKGHVHGQRGTSIIPRQGRGCNIAHPRHRQGFGSDHVEDARARDGPVTVQMPDRAAGDFGADKLGRQTLFDGKIGNVAPAPRQKPTILDPPRECAALS